MSSEDIYFGKAYVLPVFMAITATITLVTIQIVAHLNGSVPDWWFFAPFSVTAANKPQSYVYGVGMSLTVLLFSLTMYLIFRAFLQRGNSTSQFILKICIPLVFIAAVGCLVQAWVCLQPDIIAYMDIEHTNKGPRPKYTVYSLVHTIAAGIFFSLSGLFITIVSLIIYNGDVGICSIIRPSSKWMKYISNTIMILSVITGFMIHPAVSQAYNRDMYNTGGFMQWICVFSLVFYISSFSMDIVNHRDKLMHEYNRGRGMDPAAYSEVDKKPSLTASRRTSMRRENEDDEATETTLMLADV